MLIKCTYSKKCLVSFCSLILCFNTTICFSQKELSSDYLNPTQIDVNMDCELETFVLRSNGNGNDSTLHVSTRYDPDNVYFFQFNSSKKDISEVQIEFDRNLLWGMEFFIIENGEFKFLKSETYKNSYAKLFLTTNDSCSNEEILVKIWTKGISNSDSVKICITEHEAGLSTKSLGISTVMYTPQELVEDVLISGCLIAENIVYTGSLYSIAYFYNGIPGLDFEDGVLICTGYASDASGPNLSESTGEDMWEYGDPQLDEIALGWTQDAAVLEFDFVPASDVMEFEYVFASDEYPEYANTMYNDAFGFFISGGPEGYVNENIALIPGTSIPVTINNVNDVDYPGYYNDNTYGPNIEYDGILNTFTAIAQLTACETYHLKLAIGDVGDGVYDSAVFLKANSFSSGAAYTVESYNAWDPSLDIMRGCLNYIIISRTDSSSINMSVPVEFTISGTASSGEDYSLIPESLEIPAGEQSITVYFDAFDLGYLQGDETIIIEYINGCPCEATPTQYVITIVDPFEIAPQITNNSPICIGDTAEISLELNTSLPEYVSIEWSTGEIGTNQIQVSPDVTSNYSVEIVFPCDTIVLSTEIEVVMPPIVDLGPDFEIAGLSTSIDADMEAGNDGYWNFINGPGNADIDPDTESVTFISVDQYGIYTFSWTEISLAPNCVNSDEIDISFYHVPTADFSFSPVLCFGDNSSVLYTGTIIPGLTELEWDFGLAELVSGSGVGPYILSFQEPGTYIISLTVTEDSESVVHSHSIFVPEALSGNLVSFDDPCFQTCQGSAEISVSGGTLPYSYSWNSSTNEINGLCAGDYSVTVTDQNLCTFSDMFTIMQAEPIEYDTSFNNVDCYGTFTGNASISVSGGSSPYQYIWSDGYNMPIHNAIGEGIYIVTVVDSNNCSISETFNINQPNLLQVFTSGNHEACENESVVISSQASGGTMPYIYYWDENNTGFEQGLPVFEITADYNTFYTVYVEDAKGCVSNYTYSQVIVSPEMQIGLSVIDAQCEETCNGEAFVEVTGGLQPFSYSWSSNSPLLENLCAGIYTLTVTDNIGCFADTVFFIEAPTALQLEIETEDAACSYSTGTSTAIVSGGMPPYNYSWVNGEDSNILEGQVGMYYLTVTDNNNCRILGTAVIDSPQELLVSLNSNYTICLGGEANVTAQATGGSAPYYFSWTGSDNSHYYGHNISVSPETTTSYYLSLTDGNGCVIDGYRVQVNVLPPLEINIINSISSICRGRGTEILFDVSGGNGGPYQVNTNEGEIVISPYMVYPDSTTNLIFTAEDMCETPQVSDSILISVYDKPFVDFEGDILQGCPGHEVHYLSLDTSLNYQYVWDFGDSIFAFIRNPIHAYEYAGLYDVMLTIHDEFGCANNIRKENYVEIYPGPYSNFEADPLIASILNPRIKFLNHSDAAMFYFWYYGDGDSTINFRNPVHTFPAIGYYDVMLVCENEYSCTDTAVREIFIKDENTIWAPTAFTPNGDGSNDCFKLCGHGIDPHFFTLIIYDRWGIPVFTTNKYFDSGECVACGEGAWDGSKGDRTKGDEYCPIGLYYWYVKFLDYDGIGYELSGKVSLIR